MSGPLTAESLDGQPLLKTLKPVKAQALVIHYRLYTAAHTDRLAFIRHCRDLDMALEQIRSLLRLRDSPPKDCSEVSALLADRIGHVVQRSRELRALEKDLQALRAGCTSPHAMDSEACRWQAA